MISTIRHSFPIFLSIVLFFGLFGIAKGDIPHKKASSMIKRLAVERNYVLQKAKSRSISNDNRKVTSFVRCSDADVLRQHNCKIMAQWDDIYIAEIPIHKLPVLLASKTVQRIEAGEPCEIQMDTTRILVNADNIPSPQNNNINLTGKGVIIGIQDVGFDLTHPTFRSIDGERNRIVAFWDQLDFSSEGSEVTFADSEEFSPGRQYLGESEIISKAHSTDALEQDHGSHTLGICGGSGFEGDPSADRIYQGIAPEADLCLVSPLISSNKDLIPDSLQSLYTTATEMLGFKYIFDFAESQGKPCVINYSLGSYDDLYEHELYGEVLKKMVGPGKIICGSAGNETINGAAYIHKAREEEKAGAFLKNNNSGSYAYLAIQSEKPISLDLSFYPHQGDSVKWSYNTEGLRNFPDSLFMDVIQIDSIEYSINLMVYPSCYDSTLFATELYIEGTDNIKMGYEHPISLALTGKNNDIECFGHSTFFIDNSLDPSLKQFEISHNILFPGSVEDIICVGSTAWRSGIYNTENTFKSFSNGKNGYLGKISYYSSIGPTIDGRLKPDVVAPGQPVISAFNHFIYSSDPDSNKAYHARYFTYNGEKYGYVAKQGTSMACPVVTGVVALWLEEFPQLTPDDIKDVIAHSSSHLSDISYPNYTYGHGQIDAMAGIDYLRKNYTGIEAIREKASADTMAEGDYYDMHGQRIYSLQPGNVYIHSLTGKKFISK